jgi:hypothetical protein
MNSYVKRLYFMIVTLFGGVFPSTLLLAEPTEDGKFLCGKLESLVQDPLIGVRVESRTDGFVLRMQSRNPESQKAARSFAVEVLKEHDLLVDVPRTNGYGLPEQ